MKNLFLTYLFLLGGAIVLKAQPELPADYRFDCVADYQAYSGLAKECIDWLVETPMDQNEVERSQLTAFAMKWLTGHPNIRIEFDSAVMPFANELPEMLVIFMLGASREVLKEGKVSEDPPRFDLAGFEAVLQQARMTESLADDEALREWFDMESRGELPGWILQQRSGK